MITHASLFSGIGACDLAAHQLGIKNVFNVEINPFCRKILDFWFPESIGYTDVKTTDFTKHRGEITILSGGFPCQEFSLAGQRRGTEDDRYLWPELLRAVHEIRPAYVLGENVFGILSMVESTCEIEVGSEASLFGEDKKIYERRGRSITRIIREDLEREGYALQIFCIPACAVGAPHRRDRIWFVAKRVIADTAREGWGAWWADDGRETSNETERPEVRGFDGGFSEERSSAHTNGAGLQEEGRELAAAGTTRNVPLHDTSDTEGGRAGGLRDESEAERARLRDVILGVGGGLHDEGLPADRFEGFPTTFPTICGGDDGIQPIVDALTIPFARWRAESVKAYGNSMQVGVVHEILRAIIKDIENDGYNG